MIQEVHWHGEDDGGVVLGSDTAQGLKVPELQLQSSGYNIRAREEADLGDARAGRPPPPLLLKKRPKIYESTTAYTKKAARCDLPARPRSSRQ